MISQNVEAMPVLQDAASFENTREALAVLRILVLHNQAVVTGKAKPVADVIARLRAKQTTN